MTSEAHKAYSDAYYAVLNDRFVARQSSTALKRFDARAEYFDHLAVGSVLDVGCERGYFLENMRKRGWQIEGVEPYKPFADYARTDLGLNVHNKQLQDLPRCPAYDLITLWHVLEHFSDPLEALGHCRALLRPGGVLFFEVPNINSLGPLFASHYWSPFREPTHRWFFRIRSIEMLAAAAGLEVEKAMAGTSPGDWYGLKRGIQSRMQGLRAPRDDDRQQDARDPEMEAGTGIDGDVLSTDEADSVAWWSTGARRGHSSLVPAAQH